MALYSLFKLTTMCAVFQAAAGAAFECTGTRTPESSPYGVYANEKPVPTKYGVEVKTVDLIFETKPTAQNFKAPVTYTQDLTGCLFEYDSTTGTYECKNNSPTIPLGPSIPYTDGRFIDSPSSGSKFMPIGEPSGPMMKFEEFINNALDITWCPKQNWFVVKVEGPEGAVAYKLKSLGPMDPSSPASLSQFFPAVSEGTLVGAASNDWYKTAQWSGMANDGTTQSVAEVLADACLAAPSCVGFHLIGGGRLGEGALLYDSDSYSGVWPPKTPDAIAAAGGSWRWGEAGKGWNARGKPAEYGSVKVGKGWNTWKAYRRVT